MEQKRPGRPLNITSLVRLSSAVPNQISVTWAPEIGKVRTCSKPHWNSFQLFVFSLHPPVLELDILMCLKTVIVTYLLRLFDHIVFQTYSMSVYLVRQLTSPLLLQRLRMKGIRNPDHSRALSNYTANQVFSVSHYKI